MKAHEITKIQEQEGLLAALENTDLCTFWYFPQEKRITMSERTARMYSCRQDYLDMPGSFADDFVHPSTRLGFFEMYRRIDAGEKTAQASFSSMDRKNWCTVTMTTVSYDAQGRPERVYGIVQNISELKMQEAEYHSSRRILAGVVEALSKIYMFNYYIDLETMEFTEIVGLDDITATLGIKGNAIHAFEQFTETLVDKNFKEEFRAFVDMATIAKRIGTRQNISLEYLSVKNGWCRASFIVVRRNAAGLVVRVEFVIENISAEREKELEAKEALEKAYQAANKANVSKSAFLTNMSHDIRTPMNAIVGFCAIASSHIDDKERVQDCITKITAASRQLLSIINEVLDMSRIESGKVHIQEQEANLPAMMKDFMSVVQGQIRRKGLQFFVDTLDLVHENVYVDEGRFHRVLLNLVGNSIKFTPSGGTVSVRLAEKPQTSDSYGNYVVSVKDNGIGMSRDFLPHVFEAFERERTSTISKVEGTGLGMAITKNIVEMMGGNIRAESEEGKGSVFTVDLSLRIMDKEIGDPKIERLAGLRALVVDDDYNVCDSVSRMLDKIGMQPEWAMSGEEAVCSTRSALETGCGFSVYIVDWRLPDMYGAEIVRQLRRLVGDEIPIIILTAYDICEIEEEAKQAGATELCQKPLFMSQLRCVLTKAAGEEKKTQKKAPLMPDGNLCGKHILLVEDNALNQEIAEAILSEAGFIIEMADDGKEAVDKMEAAKEGDYDLILTDIQMPVMDGYEAVRKIRAMQDEWKKKLPIFAMTANAFEEDRQKAFEAGMNGHLTKPIDMDELFGTLSEALK